MCDDVFGEYGGAQAEQCSSAFLGYPCGSWTPAAPSVQAIFHTSRLKLHEFKLLLGAGDVP